MDDKICPLCGQDNNCQSGNKDCWCKTVEFPEGIFDLIPEEKRGKACICLSCVNKYNDNLKKQRNIKC